LYIQTEYVSVTLVIQHVKCPIVIGGLSDSIIFFHTVISDMILGGENTEHKMCDPSFSNISVETIFHIYEKIGEIFSLIINKLIPIKAPYVNFHTQSTKPLHA
jgi:flagellar motor switch protein FliM